MKGKKIFRRRVTGQRSTALYVALAGLFVIAVAYQVRAVEQTFPQWFGVTFVQWPFLSDDEDQPNFILQFVRPNAHAAGLRDGDILVAINGIPITSRSVYADILSSSHPGGFMDVTYRRKGDPVERRARVLLGNLKSDSSLFIWLLYVVMPAFCIALGFWVVAVRVQDVRAWLLLGLLLSIGTFFNSFPYFWSPPFRTLGSIYLILQQRIWFVWLFLLGIYFPEPFPKNFRWRWWKWLAWIALPLWVILAAVAICGFVIELHSLMAAMPFMQFLEHTQFLGSALELFIVAGFLACIAIKYRIASSLDAKRRLRVLYAGAAVSLLPLTVMFIIEGWKGVNEEYFAYWLRMTIYVGFFLLPVTLAYVIVVQRAMDVSVVIRQGLQYTLARRGVLILQILLSAALFIVLTILMTSHALSPLGTVAVLAAGLWGIFLLLGATQRVAVWVDRRFFRDAYNAEQILSDLAEKVRSIVETKPLLETVAQRISDSLHVKQVAVLLHGNGPYRPEHAVGYGAPPELAFSPNAVTVQVLKDQKQPTRVYFDDPDSWIYQTPAMTNEERDQLAALHSELLLPFSVKDELLGFMSLGQKLSEAPYSSTDLRLLSSVAAQTGLALEVARLTTAMGRELAAHERFNRELEIAREVQEHLFPQRFPSISGLDYSGLCRPAREVGGDYYDFLELPAGKLGVAIGDVSGKGIGASLMMASLGASLRGQAAVVEDLTELIQRVNNLVYNASSVNRYATFFYAEYEPRDRQLSFVNAGHNPPLIVRRSNPSCQLFRLEAGGPPVGLLPNSTYEQGSFALEPGDLLVLFTDGIPESMNGDDEEWGEERLIELAKTCDGLPAM
ncbi:MAG: SpoIIE family protein phosphatase, partial [Acidobacteriaceae bacterium]|nr:SpoIIE family protein phosphatase [Acidobacteriaceae bacterium]